VKGTAIWTPGRVKRGPPTTLTVVIAVAVVLVVTTVLSILVSQHGHAWMHRAHGDAGWESP
jgi:hypothetical protein